MDLLGGYGSDDDSDASSHTSDVVAPSTVTSSYEHSQAKSESNQTNIPPPISGPTKKQRKLLSLGAVLPSEIFDKLVMMKQQAGNDEVSDDDEDDNRGTARLDDTFAAPKDNHSKRGRGACQDLLQKLKAAIPSQGGETTRTILPSTNVKSTEKLGEALLSTSYTTTKLQPGKKESPINIHSESAQVFQQNKPNLLSIKNLKTSTRPLRISAAPTVAESQVPPIMSYDNHYTTQSNSSQEVVSQSSTSKKMSKKEMERALRAGNFDSVLQDSSVTQYQQKLSQYQPIEEVDTELDSSDRIRHVAVGMYNPKVGKLIFFD